MSDVYPPGSMPYRDPTKCPVCGGPTSHDRELPPNPYVCEECETRESLEDPHGPVLRGHEYTPAVPAWLPLIIMPGIIGSIFMAGFLIGRITA